MALNQIALGKKVQGQFIVPVSGQTLWELLCADPTTADGTPVVEPGLIVRAAQSLGLFSFVGTSLQICLRYVTGQAISTQVEVQCIGFDQNLVPQRLFNASSVHVLTLTAVSATDMQDLNGYSYTDPQKVDASGCTSVIVAINTALVGGGSPASTNSALGSAIMGRALSGART